MQSRASSRSGSFAEEAYVELHRRIIECEMPPGARITEGRIVRDIGIGKTPVREALGRLVLEGLVRSIPRQGYEVTPITLGQVRELFGLRMIVEPAAVQLAAGHVDGPLLRRLDELCRTGYTLGDHASAARFLRANNEFHVAVARASGNSRLAEIVERVLDESERLFHLGLMMRNRTEEMGHEHKALVDALLGGEPDAARRIAIEQIMAAERMVVDGLLSSPALLSAPLIAPLSTDRAIPSARTPHSRSPRMTSVRRRRLERRGGS